MTTTDVNCDGGPVIEYPRILPASDSSILIEFGDTIDYETNARVYALQTEIENSDLGSSVVEFIPSYRSLLVEYDVSECLYADLNERVNDLIGKTAISDGTTINSDQNAHEIPVAYGGDYGPDLENVATHAGLTTDEVIAIHSSTDYRVFMLGFAPGFPYLGGMDSRIACPRLATPRTLVPAGAVGIAESQTGVYPNPSPGGWQIIGRTPMKLFDVDADPPSAMLPGTKVTFVPIANDEFETMVGSE
ncbi:MAG: 5-oxoprolinase subunit PxpB [Chloroflexi bacterium]|nr:5-oxoprolinase subunit PxpB [Chloroflexota bacterium]